MKKTGLLAVALLFAACSKSSPSEVGGATTQTVKAVPVTTASAEALAAFKLGRQAADNLRIPEARIHFAKALKLDPSFAQAMSMLGALTPGDKGKEMVAKAAGLAAKLPKAERLFIELATLKHQHKNKKAAALLDRIAKLAPADWRIQLKRGAMAHFSGDHDKAVGILQNAAKLNPNAGEIYNMLGYSLYAQGKTEAALTALRKYAELKPTEANPHDSLGEILAKAGKLPEAERSYLKATQVAPKFWRAWEGVAIVRFAQGNFEGGYAALAKARTAASLRKEKLKVDKMTAMAKAIEGKTDESLQLLQSLEKQALAIGKKKTWAWLPVDQAWQLVTTGKPTEAIAKLDIAVSRLAKAGLTAKKQSYMTFWTQVARSWALSKLGKAEDAAALATKVAAYAKAHPKNKHVQDGSILARAGVALAQGDARAAAGYLSKCTGQNAFCQMQLYTTLKKLGDSVDSVRQKIFGGVERNLLHVWVRTRLAKAQ